MRRFLGSLAALLTLMGVIGCGSDKANVTGPTPLALSSLQVVGNIDLTAIGQSSQLTVNALYVDGSAKDVTADTTWASNATSVVTVSRGLITAVALGTATVTAQYGGKSVGSTITVAPAGTFILDGRVREPGGGSLANVRVVEQISLTDTKTNSAGSFRLFPLSSARIRIDHPDFETFEREIAKPGALTRAVFLDVPLQRVVRIDAGLSRSNLVIAPNDVSYTVAGDLCNPCKLIRVISGGPTTLTLRLAWTGAPPGALKLWASGARNSTTGSSIVVNVPTNGGQSLVYVGWTLPEGQGASQYAFFSFSVD